MKKLFIISLFSAAACAQPAASERDVFADLQQMLNGLSKITGLSPPAKLKHEVISKIQLRKYLESRIKEAYTPQSIHIGELTLKMFGLVPQDFDLEKSSVDLLTEQAAAFYDYHKKKLFLLDTNSGEMEKLTLVHELAHALADEHFHLDKYIREDAVGDDASTARLAVMEGQASWLMLAYMAQQSGQPAGVPEQLMKLMSTSLEEASSRYPVLASAPLYMRESLAFPYLGGMAFQDAVYRKMGKAAFAELFNRPPVSTQQIIHPGAYFAETQPAAPRPPELPKASAFRKLADATMGEFDHMVLVRQYTDRAQADAIAPHLKGSTYRLYEHKSERYPVLAYASEWDTRESAEAYFGLYRKILQGKWKKFEIAKNEGGTLTGQGDNGYFTLRVEGNLVTSIEGLQVQDGEPSVR